MNGNGEQDPLALELDPTLVSEPPPTDGGESGRTQEPPKDEDKPGEASGGDGQPPEGEGGEDTGEKPKPTVEDLLKDPELGPQLQSWADKAAASQVKSATDRLQQDQQRTFDSASMSQWENYFGQFSQEELGELLAQDPQKAAMYSRVQSWRQEQQSSAGADQIATAAQVYSYAHQISVNNRLLEDSGLPQGKKDELAADKFTHLGADGVTAWSQAIQAALIEHQVEARIQKELDTRWEAYKQEKLAELEPNGSPPGSRPGSPTNPDLPIETDSGVMLEAGLEQRSRSRGR